MERRWHGKVYMNPPYGTDIVRWVDHLCWEFQAGRTTEAIALVPSRTDTKWFQALDPFPKCFIHGRLKFGDGPNAAPFPSTVVYLGPNGRRFADSFDDVGTVYR